MFDRIESRRQAWIVASGHILLHAVDPPPYTVDAASSATHRDGRRGGDQRGRGGGRGDGGGGESGGESGGADGEDRARRHDERCRQLLDNCVRPPWYKEADTEAPTVIGAVGEKMIPSLTVALTRFKANAKSLTSPKSAPASPLGGAPGTAKTREGTDAFDIAGTPHTGASLSERSSHSGRSCGRSGRSGRRSRRSRSHTPTSITPAATSTPAPAPVHAPSPVPVPVPGTKVCAICLRKSSPAALCRKCGRRAVKAFKDNQGSRQTQVILVPYGAAFGVGEPSALQREGDAVKRWVRLLDDKTGGHFYYNAHYDSSVWKSGIEPPKAAPVVKVVRRRKGGGGGGLVRAASPPNSGRATSRPESPAACLSTARTDERTASAPKVTGVAAAAVAAAASGVSTGRTALQKTRTMFSAASMAALQAATGGGDAGRNGPGGRANDGRPRTTTPTIKPALKPPASPSPSAPEKNAAAPISPLGNGAVQMTAAGNRVVILDAGDDEVVVDAHKRIYPPFRLVSWEDAEKAAAAAAAGGMEGVTPGPGLGFGRKSYSRGGSATPVDSAGGRPRSTMRAGTMTRASKMTRAGTLSAASATAAAAT